jgi:hypothetical protein
MLQHSFRVALTPKLHHPRGLLAHQLRAGMGTTEWRKATLAKRGPS